MRLRLGFGAVDAKTFMPWLPPRLNLTGTADPAFTPFTVVFETGAKNPVHAKFTVAWKVPLAAFPCASVDVHVTVVVPIRNVVPDGGTHVMETLPSTRSCADAEYDTT